jgi:hypothetical protein
MFYWIRKTRICVSLDYREDEVLEGKKIEGVGGLKRLGGEGGYGRMKLKFMDWTGCMCNVRDGETKVSNILLRILSGTIAF